MDRIRRPVSPIRLAVPALILATACVDPPAAPTAPVADRATTAARSDVLLAAARLPGDRQNRLRITSLTIDPTSLTIGGADLPGTQATWTATIENPKKQTLSNVYIQTQFVIYLPGGNINAWKAAGGALIQCPGRSPGVLPSGTCTITGTATPSNAATGSGFLVPDDDTHDAKFELELRQDTGDPTLKTLTKAAADVILFYQLS